MTKPSSIMRPKIVFLDQATLGPNIRLRRPRFDHSWVSYPETAPEDVVTRLQEAQIAITNKVALNRAILAQLPALEMIAIAATGTNIVDLEAAKEHNITVSNITSYATETVPEHVFMLILALARNLPGYRHDVAAGKWQRSGQFCFFTHEICDLAGRQLGIIGGGELGRAVARLGKAFGMKAVFAGRKEAPENQPLKPGYRPFAEVLATSDVISLHCPLTPTTRGLISTPEFQLMQRRPILINTARGGVIDELALIEALQTGRIRGAGIDVVEQEPPAPDHPYFQLLKMPNFILTPHIAWGSQQARQRLADKLIENIENFIAGQPTNVVNP